MCAVEEGVCEKVLISVSKILITKLKKNMYSETCCTQAYTRRVGVISDGRYLDSHYLGLFTVWHVVIALQVNRGRRNAVH